MKPRRSKSAIFTPRSASARLTDHHVTEERLFQNRRLFIRSGISAGVGISLAGYLPQLALANSSRLSGKFNDIDTTYNVEAEPSTYEDITSYNNFYELGFSKSDPKKNADALETDP